MTDMDGEVDVCSLNDEETEMASRSLTLSLESSEINGTRGSLGLSSSLGSDLVIETSHEMLCDESTSSDLHQLTSPMLFSEKSLSEGGKAQMYESQFHHPSPPARMSSLESRDIIDTSSRAGSPSLTRKEKSLGILCRKFLEHMINQSEKGEKIHLESTAANLDVEKRRIYDIVNVMEAVDAMSKHTKSFYVWNGLDHLPRLMAQLKMEALAENLPGKIGDVEKAMCSFTELAGGTPMGEHKKALVGTMLSSQYSGYWSKTSSTESLDRQVSDLSPANLPRNRNARNSLSMLCRRFLMVLLCSPNQNRVSLDVASTVLIKDPYTDGFEPPSRSRCRRLYDIANVLVAMGIIKKVHYLFGTKKIPLFVYCGPEPEELPKLSRSRSEHFPRENQVTDVSKKSCGVPLKKHNSLMDICEVAAIEREKFLVSQRIANGVPNEGKPSEVESISYNEPPKPCQNSENINPIPFHDAENTPPVPLKKRPSIRNSVPSPSKTSILRMQLTGSSGNKENGGISPTRLNILSAIRRSPKSTLSQNQKAKAYTVRIGNHQHVQEISPKYNNGIVRPMALKAQVLHKSPTASASPLKPIENKKHSTFTAQQLIASPKFGMDRQIASPKFGMDRQSPAGKMLIISPTSQNRGTTAVSLAALTGVGSGFLGGLSGGFVPSLTGSTGGNSAAAAASQLLHSAQAQKRYLSAVYQTNPAAIVSPRDGQGLQGIFSPPSNFGLAPSSTLGTVPKAPRMSYSIKVPGATSAYSSNYTPKPVAPQTSIKPPVQLVFPTSTPLGSSNLSNRI